MFSFIVGVSSTESTMSADRVFEHTDALLTARFKPNGVLDTAQIMTFPALVMPEIEDSSREQVARVGIIANIALIDKKYHYRFVPDEAVAPIPSSEIASIASNLQIDDSKWGEFARTHWAVKDVDLYHALYTRLPIRETGPGPAPSPICPPDDHRAVEESQSRRDLIAGSDAPIFLVHGHDTALRDEVRRFLEAACMRKVTVLAEEPNNGRDLLKKLIDHAAQASFAVVLLTPDDIGGKPDGDMKARARQNVVFELGLFIALLGRERVAALKVSHIELPTDFSGVGYVDVESRGDAWKIPLARELRGAGIDVSVDRTY